MSDTETEDTKGVPLDNENVRRARVRNMVAFWLFGLCINYPYVIMLSAAYHILEKKTAVPTQQPPVTSELPVWMNVTNSSDTKNPYDCNPSSTAIVLLADILPAIAIKYTSPWFADLIPFDARVAFCTICAAASFLIVALASGVPLSLIGIACASITGGLGEFTFLSLGAFYNNVVVSTWSSGTGAAGLFGALSYAGLTSAGMSPPHTILLMLLIPILLAGSYLFILERKPSIHTCNWGRRSLPYSPLTDPENTGVVARLLPFHEKVAVIKSCLYLIIPLVIVYVAEYFINQGLFELIFFYGSWLSHDAQYTWYQVIYQLGVFISRSSVKLIVIRRTWILALLQVSNVIIFLAQLLFFYIPSVYIVFLLIFYEGLLGGAAYVNTFYIIHNEFAAGQKEFAIGVATVSDSTGIAMSAALSVPVHNAFCRRTTMIHI